MNNQYQSPHSKASEDHKHLKPPIEEHIHGGGGEMHHELCHCPVCKPQRDSEPK